MTLESQHQPAPLDLRLGDLPRRGPFRLRPSFVPKQWLYSSLWFLLFGGLLAAFSWYGTVLTLQFLETAKIWKQGTEAYNLGYRGRVHTTNLVFKRYNLTVSYRTREGNPHQFKTEFFRFFTGPGKQAPYTIRYLPQTPKKAVISWAYDALLHGWIFVALMFGMALLMAFGIYGFCLRLIREAFLVQSMAQRGSLVAASIDRIESVTNQQTGKLEYIYHFTFSRERSYHGEYKTTDPSEHPIILGEQEKLVVLIGPSGSKYWVLRQDGYPLILDELARPL